MELLIASIVGVVVGFAIGSIINVVDWFFNGCTNEKR